MDQPVAAIIVVTSQTAQVLANIQVLLARHGAGLDDLVKSTVHLNTWTATLTVQRGVRGALLSAVPSAHDGWVNARWHPRRDDTVDA